MSKVELSENVIIFLIHIPVCQKSSSPKILTLDWDHCILGPVQLQALYALRAAIPGWLPIGRHYFLLNETEFSLTNLN